MITILLSYCSKLCKRLVELQFFTIGIVTLALGLQPIYNLKRETNQKNIIELYHNFTSVGECKGVNPNNPKLIPILKFKNFKLSQKFGTRFGGLNLIKIENFLDLWKCLKKNNISIFGCFKARFILFCDETINDDHHILFFLKFENTHNKLI